MARNRVLLVVTLLACVGAALAIWIVGSLDKQDIPHMKSDPVMATLLVLPYLLLASVALWNMERPVVMTACLLAVAIIAGLAIPIEWRDHQAWRSEPPGREVQHYGILAVLFVQWVGSLALLVLVAGYRVIIARKRRSARTAAAADHGGAALKRKDETQ